VKLRSSVATRRQPIAAGASPQRFEEKDSYPRCDDNNSSPLSPLRGFVFLFRSFPWAFAHGYLLSPHPRLKNAQHQKARARAKRSVGTN